MWTKWFPSLLSQSQGPIHLAWVSTFPMLPFVCSTPSRILSTQARNGPCSENIMWEAARGYGGGKSMGYGFRQTWSPNSGFIFWLTEPVTRAFWASVICKIGIMILTFYKHWDNTLHPLNCQNLESTKIMFADENKNCYSLLGKQFGNIY